MYIYIYREREREREGGRERAYIYIYICIYTHMLPRNVNEGCLSPQCPANCVIWWIFEARCWRRLAPVGIVVPGWHQWTLAGTSLVLGAGGDWQLWRMWWVWWHQWEWWHRWPISLATFLWVVGESLFVVGSKVFNPTLARAEL